MMSEALDPTRLEWQDRHDRPRVLMITQALPVAQPVHAGGRYVHALAATLTDHSDLIILAQDGPANRAAAEVSNVPARFALLGKSRDSTGLERWGYRLAYRLEPIIRALDPSSAFVPMVYDLVHIEALRTLVTTADVIDLQWSEYAKIAPLMRRMTPDARIISTFHDVLSQKYRREYLNATRGVGSLIARCRLMVQELSEDRAAATSTTSVVLSGKDQGELRAVRPDAVIRVVDPPLGGQVHGSWQPPAVPTVTFVGYLARPENDEAARSLVEEVWPRVLNRVPQAQLKIVGAGASERLTHLAEGRSDVQLTGFVADLSVVFSATTVAASFLQAGAGVKFKVLESVLAGVPTVTTSVGAEGIDPDLILHVEDSVADFAGALVDALLAPDVENAKARQSLAMQRYGTQGFAERVDDLYLQETSALRNCAEDGDVDVSIIIPSHNGGRSLVEQVKRLDCEVTHRSFEVIVVDNRSTDDTEESLGPVLASSRRVRRVSAHDRPGVAYARNVGVRAARGKYLLFCDSDDVVQPGWIDAMADGLDEWDMVGGRIVTTGINPEAVRKRYGLARADLDELPVASGNLRYAVGANMGFRRAAIDVVGGFDEWFDGGHEEVEMAWRVQHAGMTLGYVRNAVVEYRLRPTLRSAMRQRRGYARSASQFDRRHQPSETLSSLAHSVKWFGKQVRATPNPRNRIEFERWLVAISWTIGYIEGTLRYVKAYDER